MASFTAIRDALQTMVESAVSGITVHEEAVAIDSLPDDGYPAAAIYAQGYETERLSFLQSRRTWTVGGEMYFQVADPDDVTATRDTAVTALEALNSEIRSDKTLNSSVEWAVMDGQVLDYHPDDGRIAAVFTVVAQRVYT